MKLFMAVIFCLVSRLPLIACDRSASEILQLINEGKSDFVVKNIWPQDNCGSLIIDNIGNGEKEWLTAAVKLRNHTDGIYSTLLMESLANAMLKAPSRVLPLVNSSQKFPDYAICISQMLDDSGESDARYRENTKKARAIFERYLTSKYSKQAKACLEQVSSAEKALGMAPHNQSRDCGKTPAEIIK